MAENVQKRITGAKLVDGVWRSTEDNHALTNAELLKLKAAADKKSADERPAPEKRA